MPDKLITPIPENAPPLPKQRTIPEKNAEGKIVNWLHYEITHYWPYHNAEGQITHYVVRYQLPDGEKETPPLTLHDTVDGLKWIFKSPPAPLPLFNLHLLKKYPNAQVLVVEGEKSADAARILFEEAKAISQIIPISWQGGSNAVYKSEWEPLQGRQVILWPDNDLKTNDKTGELFSMEDQPGYRADLQIAGLLPDRKKTKIVNPDQTKPDTWDIADAILIEHWDFKQVFSFIKTRLTNLPENLPQPPAKKTHEKTNLVAPPPHKNTSTPFRCLGYNHNIRYYLPNGTGQVMAYTIAGHNANTLMALAPLEYWERYYPSKAGPAWRLAISTLFQVNNDKGVFDINRIRGRGGWIDNNRLVINTGKHLIVNGKPVSAYDFDSEFIYTVNIPLETSMTQPLNDADASKFLEFCKVFTWENPISAYLFAGWCVAAPICGALPWRPHLWLTGESGEGKSWILENVIKKILGPWGQYVQSTTTEAAIRQNLKSDALPVVFDEFESEDQDAADRVKRIIELSRSASSSDSAILKGGQDGEVARYLVRSMFLFSSINTNLTKQADLSRVSVLELRKNPAWTPDQVKEHFYQKILPQSRNLTVDFYTRLRSRTFSLMPVIAENWQTFRSAGVEFFGKQRAADQIAALIAPAYSLISSRVISAEFAREWLSKQDFTEKRKDLSHADSYNCLDIILQAIIKIPDTKEELSVAELLQNVDAVRGVENRRPYIDALKRIGIKYRYTDGIEDVLIADTYEGIRRMLRGSSFANSWARVLRRLPGAVQKYGEKFLDGPKTQATAIPMDVVRGED